MTDETSRTARQWRLLRLAVLAWRVPLDEAHTREYEALRQRLGLIAPEEWDALLASLRAELPEDREGGTGCRRIDRSGRHVPSWPWRWRWPGRQRR